MDGRTARTGPGVPITAKLVADLIAAAGVNRVLALDLHAGQLQGYFNMPVDHLFAAPVLVDHFRQLELRDLTIIAPDAGGVERAAAYAKRLDASLAIIDKRRDRDKKNVAKVMHIIGDVCDRDVLIADDIVDTAGTLVEATGALLRAGARRVFAGAAHAVLSGPCPGAHRLFRTAAARRYGHDSAWLQGRQGGPGARAVGGAAVGRGDQSHPFGRFGEFVVQLDRWKPEPGSVRYGPIQREAAYGHG